jgi:hypothetical protein
MQFLVDCLNATITISPALLERKLTVIAIYAMISGHYNDQLAGLPQ